MQKGVFNLYFLSNPEQYDNKIMIIIKETENNQPQFDHYTFVSENKIKKMVYGP